MRDKRQPITFRDALMSFVAQLVDSLPWKTRDQKEMQYTAIVIKYPCLIFTKQQTMKGCLKRCERQSGHSHDSPSSLRDYQ